MNWRNFAAGVLLLIGSTQMVGDISGNRVLKGIGAATAMAPCPRVFSDLDGLEAFSSKFEIVAVGNETLSIEITPEVYAQLKGPYNRRNVYGAAIAAAPRLPHAVWQSVFEYGFRPDGTLRCALRLPQDTTQIYVVVRNDRGGRDQDWWFPTTE